MWSLSDKLAKEGTIKGSVGSVALSCLAHASMSYAMYSIPSWANSKVFNVFGTTGFLLTLASSFSSLESSNGKAGAHVFCKAEVTPFRLVMDSAFKGMICGMLSCVLKDVASAAISVARG